MKSLFSSIFVVALSLNSFSSISATEQDSHQTVSAEVHQSKEAAASQEAEAKSETSPKKNSRKRVRHVRGHRRIGLRF